MTQTTRRTVVRGAAWTAPLIAVGVAAPAFAASVVYKTPTMALCKITHNQQNTRWLLNFTFTFPASPPVSTFTIPGNSILLDGVPTAVTVTKLSATQYRVRTNTSVDVNGLSGVVNFNYSVNGTASKPFTSNYNTGGNYCPAGT